MDLENENEALKKFGELLQEYRNFYDPGFRVRQERLKQLKDYSKQQDRTINKKKKFLEAHGKVFGNISKACKAAGIKSTKTFYNWCETDPEFKKAVEMNYEIESDYVDDAVFDLIRKGNGAMIRWYASRMIPKYYQKRSSVPPQRSGDQNNGIDWSKAYGGDDEDE